MNRRIFLALLFAGMTLCAPLTANAEESSWFDFRVILRKLEHIFFPPPVHYNYDPRMIHAAEIAESRAHKKQTWRCWKYVKDALVDSGVISQRPKSPWAKQAGDELCKKFGFTKLPVKNPYDAPVGAVVVYGGPDAGHVELRTKSGFVSDFISRTPYPRPLIGVYVKTT